VQPDVHTKVPPLYVCTMWENIDSAGPCLTKLSKVYGNSCYENDLFSDKGDKLKKVTFPNIKVMLCIVNNLKWSDYKNDIYIL